MTPENAGSLPSAAVDESAAASAGGGHAFPATQWSMVLKAGVANDALTQAALESLCRRYWYPLYAFVRRHGRDHHEAEDCTQAFLAQLLAAGGLQRARPERGRFRTFLLTGLRHYLTSEWRRTQAVKRGGGLAAIPLGPAGLEQQFAHEPADAGLSPEQAFDRSWALDLIDRTVQELCSEYEKSGRAKVIAVMAPLIWGTDNNELLSRHAAELGLTINSFTVALHRARRRLGERLRAAVAETVTDSAEIDAELRHLVAAINGTPPRG